jgi:hypothetical protein
MHAPTFAPSIGARALLCAPVWAFLGSIVGASPMPAVTHVPTVQEEAARPDARDAWAAGRTAPSIELRTTQRTTWRLEDERGRVVLLAAVTASNAASRATLGALVARGAELRANGVDVAVVAIVREPQLDRVLRLAELEPTPPNLVWDPFLTVAAEATTLTAVIDPAGTVRALDVDLSNAGAVRAACRTATEGASSTATGTAPFLSSTYVVGDRAHAAALGPDGDVRTALSRLLWSPPEGVSARSLFAAAIEAVEARAAAPDARPIDHVRAGDLRWLRRGTASSAPGDGAAAVAHWLRAARSAPTDEVLTSRLRALGPRLAKREPMYAWAAEGESAGCHPLSLAERLGPSTELPRLAGSEAQPDAERAVEPDREGLVVADAALVPNVDLLVPGAERAVVTARLHIVLVPAEGVRIDSLSEAPRAWLVVPQGFAVERNSHTFELDPSAPELRPSSIDLEVLVPPGVTRGTVRGYVLASVFDRAGRRRTIRHELNVPFSSLPIE